MKQEAEGRKVTLFDALHSFISFIPMVHLPLPSIFTEFLEVRLGIQRPFPSHSHPAWLGRQGIQGPKSHRLKMIGVMIGSTNTTVTSTCDYCCSPEMAS